MRIFIYSVILASLMIFSSQGFSSTPKLNNSLIFQCNQEKILLNGSNIESATAEKMSGANNNYVINIKLKPSSAAELAHISKANIGKVCTLIFNKKVISSTTIRSSLGASR